ncbi:ATP-binding protein [uncultured Gimesia sp.]|uniref:ATP-binding protein n=1 Tax=uncultured Gimesia sp. TaxID=1678688 RepID=UPI0030D822FF|tara:strand:+ start:54412 stop:55830 length:1419 start_codon:yes stop_codon:yes gene_type:complete
MQDWTSLRNVDIDGEKLVNWLQERKMTNEMFADKAKISIESIKKYRQAGRERRRKSVYRKNFENMVEALSLEDPRLLLWGEFSRFKPSDDRLSADVDLFEALIEDRTAFVAPESRKFVLDDISSFQEQYDAGYYILEGDPGVGKSTIMSKYIRNNDCVRHFNVVSDGITEPKQFLRNVCTQILTGYSLGSAPRSLPEDNHVDGSLLRRMLEEAAEKSHERVLLVVDALDEVDTSSQDPYSNVLFLPQTLPNGVHVVVSTRRVKDLRLVSTCPRKTLDLRNYPQENKNDAEGFIRHLLEDEEFETAFQTWISCKKISTQDAIEDLVEKSECNFMYLHYLLSDIAHDPVNVAALPQGLIQYYHNHFRRMLAHQGDRPKVLFYLTVSKVAPTVKEISAWSKLNMLTIQQTLDEWQPFLRIEIDAEKNKRYSIYHNSFREFLMSDDAVRAAGMDRGEAGYGKAISDFEEIEWNEEF